jgi:hypothetical protein
MAEGDDNFALNTIITIIIATLIIICPPLIAYTGSRWGGLHADDEALIDKFIIDSKDLSKFNTGREMYLFSTYFPYRKIKGCSDKQGDELYAKYISNASKIIENLKNIKEEAIKRSKVIEKDAEEKRLKAKTAREDKEHDMEVLRVKEAGAFARHDADNRFKWVNMIVSLLSSTFRHLIENGHKFLQVAIKIVEMFVRSFLPILKALAANKVVMGFIILVFCIYMILGLLKKKTAEKNTGKIIGGVPVASGFSLSYIYDDIMDTYNYYKDMANSFSVSDYTGGLFKTEDDEKLDEEEDDETVISRETLGGGQYDNRSYMNIREIFGSENVEEYFGKGTIEAGKYYNIYLPNERFKESPNLKWKHIDAENKNKGERIWGLDCESLDTIKNADGGDSRTPAFISDNDKCIINKGKLDAIYKPRSGTGDSDGKDDIVVFATEYIK